MYTDNNTNVSILRKLPCDGYTLKDFYNDSKDKHFWFVKTEIGPYMRFMHSAYTSGNGGGNIMLMNVSVLLTILIYMTLRCYLRLKISF